MSISNLKAEISKIKDAILSKKSSSFRYERTSKGNLRLIFEDGKKKRLPIIDLRGHQLELQNKLFIEGCKRIYVWRPRRAGKEVESWNMIIQGALVDPGLYLMIYPTNVRARMILWDGAIVMPDGSSLSFLNMLPKNLIASINKQEMKIKLTNGSVIHVLGSDIDPDKLRGVNARGIVMSEYAFCDPRVRLILMPVLRQNGGWLILQTTPNGMNHAYDYMKEMQNNDQWFCRVDNAMTIVDENGNRYITDEQIEEERRSGMPEWLIQQEYFCNIEANLETLYFSAELIHLRKDRLISDYFLPDKKVNLFLDIGWNDSTAMILAQSTPTGDPAIIAYHENNNKAFEYYIRWAEAHCAKLGLIIGVIFAPHDGQKTDWNTGKNTVDFGSDLGYQVEIVPRPSSKFNSIQSMRKMMYRVKINKEHCHRLLECLSNYSKEYDDKKGRYKDAPLHNWASHGVDSFQTLTLAYDGNMVNDKHYEVGYYSK